MLLERGTENMLNMLIFSMISMTRLTCSQQSAAVSTHPRDMLHVPWVAPHGCPVEGAQTCRLWNTAAASVAAARTMRILS